MGTKTTALPSGTPAASDILAIVQGGVSKQASIGSLLALMDPKTEVRAVATSNIASLSGLATTVDGVAFTSDGMRVGLVAQSTASQNGPWVVHAGAWTRPTDFATGAAASGATFIAIGGTLGAGSGWVCTSAPGADVVDTNNLTFQRFGAPLSNATPAVQSVLGSAGTDVSVSRDDHSHPAFLLAPVEAVFDHTSGNHVDVTLTLLVDCWIEKAFFRVSEAIVGGGTVTGRIGITTGGQEIVTDSAMTSGTALGTVAGGKALSGMGSSMPSTDGYEGVFAAGTVFTFRFTTSVANITAGKAKCALKGFPLP
jgi:hypothetical protein